MGTGGLESLEVSKEHQDVALSLADKVVFEQRLCSILEFFPTLMAAFCDSMDTHTLLAPRAGWQPPAGPGLLLWTW